MYFFILTKVKISGSIYLPIPACVFFFQWTFIGNSTVLWWSDDRVTSADNLFFVVILHRKSQKGRLSAESFAHFFVVFALVNG